MGEMKVRDLALVVLFLFIGYSSVGQLSISANSNAGCTPLPVVISANFNEPITSYLWQVTFPNNNTVSSSDTQYIGVFAMPGTYSVTLTVNGTETIVETDFITVYAPPTAGIAVDEAVGCAPHCVQYSDASTPGTGTISSWSWDFGNGVLSNQQNPTYCYQNPGNFTPILSVEDEFGCFTSISVPQMISVSNALPVASFTPSTLNDCNPPSTVSFENNSSGNGIISEWNFDNGFSETTVGPTEVSTTFNTVGSYNVCLTVTNDIGCEAEQCQTISIVDPPTPEFSVSEDLLCSGGYVSFVDTGSPQAAAVEWDFDGDGIVDATGTEVFFQYNTPGTYTPVLTAYYSGNCVGVSDQDTEIEVLPALQSSFTASETVACSAPLTVDFTNTSAGTNFISYEWLIDGVSVGSDENFSYTFDELGVYDVSLVVESALCLDTLTVEDYIAIEEPSITFNLPAQICTETSVPISNVDIESSDPVTEIDWDFDGDGTIDATGPNPDYSYDTPGVYLVVVYLTTQSGCNSVVSANSNIIVQPGVIADFQSDLTTACASTPITFCANDMVQNTTYGWNFGAGTPWVSMGFPNDCVTYTYQDTGYFDVTLSVYNTACNALIVLEDYIYIPPPVALFSYTQDCNNTNEVVFLSESIEADSLIWDFGDGSLLVYNDPNPTHTFPGPGSYQVTLEAFNFETGCFDDVTQTVSTSINPIIVNAVNPIGCGPHTTGFNSPNNTQYPNWAIDFGNGVTATATLGANTIWQVTVNQPSGTINYTNSLNVNWWPQVTYQNQGTYDVTITATDPGGCSYTYTYENLVTVLNDPIFAQFDVNVIDDCDEVIVNLVPTGDFVESAQWTFGDGGSSAELSPTYQFFPPWDYDFTASVIVTDEFGCTSTITEDLGLVAPAEPAFTIASDPSCIAEVITLTNESTGEIVAYTWDFGDPGTPDNISDEFEPQHSYTTNGSYTVCLTVENTGGCEQTFCVDNGVNIISPVAEITYTPQINNCLFGVQFENTTDGELLCSDWSFGDGQFGGGIDPYHTYSIGVYDVQLIVCNEYGCYDSTTVYDIFNLSNVIGQYTTVLDEFDCAPFQVAFSSYNPNDQSFTYFWDYGDGSGDPDNNTAVEHTYNAPGVYCPTLVMQDPNGCTFLIECEESIEVTEFSFDMSSVDPVCFGEASEFNVSGGTSYSFSHPEYITNISDNVFEVNANESVNIAVTGQFADCQQTQTLEVVIYQLPEVTLDLPEGVCFDSPAFSLTGGLPEGATGVYYIEGEESSVFSPSMAASNDYEILYSFTDNNGCENSALSSMTIWELPEVTLDPIADQCELDPEFALTGGWPMNGSYTLNGVEAVAFDPSAGYGEYPLEYTFTDDNECSSSESVTITVHPSPVPMVTPPELCWEPVLTVESSTTIAQGSIETYEWDLGGYGEDSGVPTAEFSVDGPMTITVQLTVTSDQGCAAETEVEIPVFATPVAAFSTEDICAGELLFVDDLSTSDGAPVTSWQWSYDGISFSLIEQPPGLQVNDWGTYDVSLTVTTDEGCSDAATEPVIISPLPVIDLATQNICAGEEAVVFSNTTLPNGEEAGYQWGNGLGDTGIDDENLSETYTQPGDYTIELTAESGPGCATSTSIVLTVHPTPVAQFAWENAQFCANGSAEFEDLSSIEWGNIVSWAWSANGSPFSNDSEASLTVSEPGDYTISLVVTSSEGCSGSVTHNNALEVWPNPTADFYIPADLPSSAAPYIFVTDLSSGANDWQYTFSDGAVYDDPDFTHEFTIPGLYDLQQMVTNAYGCSDSLSVRIDYNPELNVFVPNAFTPDGDGLNEVFKPVISGATLNHYRFIIVNRWGETVFESTNPDEGWIGNFRSGGHYVNTGVYVWQLEVGTVEDAVRDIITGHVTVVR